MLELIRRLCETYGPSGNEEAVRQVIQAEVEAHADEVWTDALGNLVAVRKPRGGGGAGRPAGRKVMLAAHMDEIGVVVTHIDEKGFARIAAVGGLSPLTLLGQQVAFADGAAASVGSERLDEVKQIGDLTLEKLYLDLGAVSKAETEQRVRVGDMATFRATVQPLGEHRVVGKALDDRIGCAVLVQVCRELEESPHEVYFTFTSQEEVGLRGARTAAFRIAPDVAIAVDVTSAGDTPKGRTLAMELGKGAAIKVKDQSVIAHPGLRRLLQRRAEEHHIPHQLEVLDRGGTDAGSIHLSREGVPTGAVSIPTRSLHTPAEVADLRDVRACVDLLLRTLEGDLEL